MLKGSFDFHSALTLFMCTREHWRQSSSALLLIYARPMLNAGGLHYILPDALQFRACGRQKEHMKECNSGDVRNALESGIDVVPRQTLEFPAVQVPTVSGVHTR